MGKTTKSASPTTDCCTKTTNKTDFHSSHKQSDDVKFDSTVANAFKREYNTRTTYIAIFNTMVHPDIYRFDYTALFINKPTVFSEYLQSPLHSNAIVEALTSRRQNMLHLTAKYNRSELVPKLLSKGCQPDKQDYDGNTPFHIALQLDHIECIVEFLKVMEAPQNDHDSNVKRMQDRLKNMLRLYSHTGYTIIHMTVLKNLPEILAALLKFCLKHDIDVLQSEVLGCGDSLLHLAVKMHAVDVARVIVEYIPESVHERNYAGALAYDVDAISDEMFGLFKVRRRR